MTRESLECGIELGHFRGSRNQAAGSVVVCDQVVGMGLKPSTQKWLGPSLLFWWLRLLLALQPISTISPIATFGISERNVVNNAVNFTAAPISVKGFFMPGGFSFGVTCRNCGKFIDIFTPTIRDMPDPFRATCPFCEATASYEKTAVHYSGREKGSLPNRAILIALLVIGFTLVVAIWLETK